MEKASAAFALPVKVKSKMSVRFRVNEKIGKCDLPLFDKIELKRRQHGFVSDVTRRSQKGQSR